MLFCFGSDNFEAGRRAGAGMFSDAEAAAAYSGYQRWLHVFWCHLYRESMKHGLCRMLLKEGLHGAILLFINFFSLLFINFLSHSSHQPRRFWFFVWTETEELGPRTSPSLLWWHLSWSGFCFPFRFIAFFRLFLIFICSMSVSLVITFLHLFSIRFVFLVVVYAERGF